MADILVPNLPCIGEPGSLIYAPNGIHLNPGGHSSNVAMDLVQLGLADVTAVGAVGRDEIGKLLVSQLKNRGVIPYPELKTESTTAKNIALLVKGEDRRFISELTANSLLSLKHLEYVLLKTKPGILYQGTLGGLPDIENSLTELLRQTRNLGIISFIDVIMPTNGWSYLKSALPFIDILHANVMEAKSFTGETNQKKIVEKIVNGGVSVALVTDGSNGLIAGTRNHFIEMPAFDVNQIDPTGAGDALSAGIIAYIKNNNITRNKIIAQDTLIELLIQGHAAGAACVTGIGATTNVTKEKVEHILNNQRENILKKTQIEVI